MAKSRGSDGSCRARIASFGFHSRRFLPRSQTHAARPEVAVEAAALGGAPAAPPPFFFFFALQR